MPKTLYVALPGKHPSGTDYYIAHPSIGWDAVGVKYLRADIADQRIAQMDESHVAAMRALDDRTARIKALEDALRSAADEMQQLISIGGSNDYIAAHDFSDQPKFYRKIANATRQKMSPK